MQLSTERRNWWPSRAWRSALALGGIAALGVCSATAKIAPHAIPELAGDPRLDGVIEENAWKDAARFTDFSLYNKEERATAPTTALCGYTSNALYVAFVCDEPQTDKLQAGVPPEVFDDGRVTRDDCVELFAAPGGGSGNYYHFAVNSKNARYDQYNTLYPRRQVNGWNGEWQSATRVEPGKRWTVEMAIPWYNFGADLGRGQWAVQFCRAKKTLPVEFSAFTFCHGSFHNLEDFTKLDGPKLDLSRFMGLKIAGLQVDSYDISGRGYAYLVSGGVAASHTGTVRLVVTDCPLSGKPTAASTNLTLNPKQDAPFTVRLDIPALGPRYVRFRLEDPADGAPLLVNGLGADAFPALFSACLDRSYYTHEKQAQAVFHLKLPRLTRPLTGKALVALPGGEKVFPGRIEDPHRSAVAIPLENVPIGCFPVKLVVEDEQGNVVGQVNDWLRREKPASAGTREVKTDRDQRRVLIDGQPFFPLGIFGVPIDQMKTLKEAGFNIASTWSNEKTGEFNTATDAERRKLMWPYFDACQSNGLLTIANPLFWTPFLQLSYGAPDFSAKALAYAKTYLPAVIRIAAEHPAVIGFTTMDEPGPDQIVEARAWGEVMRQEAPYHMRFVLFCNQIYDWREFGDAALCDLYPWNVYGTWAEHADRPVNVGRQSEEYCTPFIHVPVLELWSGRMLGLTGGQQRSQIYLGLIGGVKGIMWWVWPARYHDNWEAVKQVAREVNTLAPVLLDVKPRQRIDYTRQADRDLLRALVQNHDGKTYLIACSPDCRPIRATFRLPDIYKGKAKVLFEDRSVPVKSSALTDDLDGYGRRVLELEGLWPDDAVLTLEAEVRPQPEKEQLRVEAAQGKAPDSTELNLILNPGFETEGTWVFEGPKAPAGQSSVEMTTAVVAGGQRAARLVCSKPDGACQVSGWRLELKPNSRYVFGGRIRVKGGRAVIALEGLKGAEVTAQGGGDWWSAYEGVCTTGPDPVWVTPVCRLVGQGEAVFDEVFLRRLSGDIRNVLKNPGFERDVWFLPGWTEAWGADGVTQAGYVGDPKGPWRTDTAEKFEGQRSLRLERTAAEDPQATTQGLTAGQGLGSFQAGSYVMSFYAKADRPGVTLYNYVGWHNFRRHKITDQWARYEYPVKIKEGEQMFVRLGVLSPGIVWIDAVQLEKGEKATDYQGD